jgi:hypothetical protein
MARKNGTDATIPAADGKATVIFVILGESGRQTDWFI